MKTALYSQIGTILLRGLTTGRPRPKAYVYFNKLFHLHCILSTTFRANTPKLPIIQVQSCIHLVHSRGEEPSHSQSSPTVWCDSNKNQKSEAMSKLMDKAKQFVADKIAEMEKPSADITDVSIKNVNRDAITLESAVDISNPYSHDLPICEISYRILSAERVIASGTILDPGSVKAKDKTAITVPAKVPYNFLLSILRDIGTDWDIDYTWEIGLNLHIPIVGKFTLPLTRRGTLKLPTLSDIF